MKLDREYLLKKYIQLFFPKLFNLLGMAEINIAEIDTLEKKSKKDLILLFCKKEFFINLL